MSLSCNPSKEFTKIDKLLMIGIILFIMLIAELVNGSDLMMTTGCMSALAISTPDLSKGNRALHVSSIEYTDNSPPNTSDDTAPSDSLELVPVGEIVGIPVVASRTRNKGYLQSGDLISMQSRVKYPLTYLTDGTNVVLKSIIDSSNIDSESEVVEKTIERDILDYKNPDSLFIYDVVDDHMYIGDLQAIGGGNPQMRFVALKGKDTDDITEYHKNAEVLSKKNFQPSISNF